MLQKELAKRLRARYNTKMDGSGWLEEGVLGRHTPLPDKVQGSVFKQRRPKPLG